MGFDIGKALGGIGGAAVGSMFGMPGAGAMLGASLFGNDKPGNIAGQVPFNPINVRSGLGSATFADGTYTTSISPALRQYQQQLFGLGGGYLQQAAGSPLEAAGLFTNQLTQLAAPQEEQARLAQENRLFSQGLLSSSTGSQRMADLAQAQQQAQNQRALLGLQYGQQQQQNLFNMGIQGLGAGINVEQAGVGLLNPAAQMGGTASAAQAQAQQLQFQNAQNRQDAQNAFWSTLGQNLSGFNWGGAPAPSNVGFVGPQGNLVSQFQPQTTSVMPSLFSGGIR